MKSPLDGGYGWLELSEVESTQSVAKEELRSGGLGGIVLTHLQTSGVGRFGRPWITGLDDSLTMTMIFRQYPSHPKPYLIGMAVAIAVAGVAHAQLQWPNDVVIGGKKVAGLLTEMVADGQGRQVALVGVGLNLNQQEFPDEIAHRAVSLSQAHGGSYEPMEVAQQVVERLATLPEPNEWSDLAPIWGLFDRTPGKRYSLPNGKEAVAIAIGSAGQLLCSVGGESQTVLAGDAIFGESVSEAMKNES